MESLDPTEPRPARDESETTVNETYDLEVQDAAQLLGVSRTRLSQLTSKGVLSFERRKIESRNRLFYSRDELLRYLSGQQGRVLGASARLSREETPRFLVSHQTDSVLFGKSDGDAISDIGDIAGYGGRRGENSPSKERLGALRKARVRTLPSAQSLAAEQGRLEWQNIVSDSLARHEKGVAEIVERFAAVELSFAQLRSLSLHQTRERKNFESALRDTLAQMMRATLTPQPERSHEKPLASDGDAEVPPKRPNSSNRRRACEYQSRRRLRIDR